MPVPLNHSLRTHNKTEEVLLWPLQSVFGSHTVAASSLALPGGASDPGRDTGDNTLLFDGAGATELITGVMQLPASWEEGSLVYPYLSWCKTTSASGTLMWQFSYVWGDIGATFGALSSPVSGTLFSSDSNTANKYAVTTFGSIDGVGKKIGSIIKWQLQRVSGDAGDTYGADAKMLSLSFGMLNDSTGSAQNFFKNQG